MGELDISPLETQAKSLLGKWTLSFYSYPSSNLAIIFLKVLNVRIKKKRELRKRQLSLEKLMLFYAHRMLVSWDMLGIWDILDMGRYCLLGS